VVLVNNGSTDPTETVIDDFRKTARMPVRCVSEPSPGLARARNAGVNAARGQILAFTDDDCYPQPDYLPVLANLFEEHRPGFVGGRVILHDPLDARIAIRDDDTPQPIPPKSYVRPGLIHGANMAVSRAVILDIGGFDPHLGAGTRCFAGEDTEFLARAAWAGWEGRYDPGLVVAHHHGRRPGPDTDRHLIGYDYGRGAYFACLILHPRARSVYLPFSRRHIAKCLRKGRLARLAREAIGAGRYLRARLLGRRLST
jgi:glycosyltransferase involved in cell wall biosynthesis